MVYRASCQVVPLVKLDKADIGVIWNMASRTRRVIAGAAVAVGLMAGLTGTAGATGTGNEGCTPGYWKNHTSNWEEYTTSTKLKTVFTFPASLASYGELTFLQALNLQGGTGLDGAVRILLRHAVAAFLNAAHEGVGYPYRRFAEPGFIQSDVNAALASLNRGTILALAADLDQKNNLGCPL